MQWINLNGGNKDQRARNGEAHEDAFKFKAARNQKYTMHNKKKKRIHTNKQTKNAFKTTPGSAIIHTNKILISKKKILRKNKIYFWKTNYSDIFNIQPISFCLNYTTWKTPTVN